MLLCNPNYATRFRTLGDSYVTQGHDSFDNAFASVTDEIAFEYAFFLEHMDVGYRVDLCRWDWQKRFHTLDSRDCECPHRGGARLPGFGTDGRGRPELRLCDHRFVGHHGGGIHECRRQPHGTGRMVAVVLDAFRLGEPFELGNQGKFVAPNSGNLYLRCQDEWNQLQDNHGAIQVRFTRSAKTGR